MQRLEAEAIQKEITAIWNKLGLEGEGEVLKLAAHHCLLGVQEALSHPQDYTWLEKFSSAFHSHPQFNEFKAFKQEIETGYYQIHFSFDKRKGQDSSLSIYLMTSVDRADQRAIAPEVKGNIEKWAAIVGYEILENDINRILKLQHEAPLVSQLIGRVKVVEQEDSPKVYKPRKP